MRDSHKGMPELMEAYERNGHFFGIVRIEIGETAHAVEFGLTPSGFRAMKAILSLRPFDRMPGLSYRYFFAGKYGKGVVAIRVELGKVSKQLDVNTPQELVANLLWFASVDDPAELVHLRHCART